MKNIIVAIDFSPSSVNAANYAAALAQNLGAELTLFHAYHIVSPPTSFPSLYPQVDDKIVEQSEKLKLLGEKLALSYSISIRTICRPSFVLNELNLPFSKDEADLLVMGMAGYSLKYKLFGSVTVSAIRNGQFPVLAIPYSATFVPIKKILLAYKPSDITPGNELAFLKNAAKVFNASIHVVHVEKEAVKEELIAASSTSSETRHSYAELEARLAGVNYDYKAIVDKDVIRGIQKEVQEFQPEILAMIPHKLEFWDEFFYKGNINKMAYHTSIPLLAIPNPK